MRLVEKNMIWASFLSCSSLKQGLISEHLSTCTEGEASCTGVASKDHTKHHDSVAGSSHTPPTVKNNPCSKSGSLRRQGCLQRPCCLKYSVGRSKC